MRRPLLADPRPYTLNGVKDPTCAFDSVREPRIVFEGRGVVVAAKPAGMHCAPAGVAGTLCDWMFGQRPKIASIAGRERDEGGLLHRLDSATAGLVAFAASDGAFEAMRACAAAGRFAKGYLALCEPGGYGLAGSKPLLGWPEGAAPQAWAEASRRMDLKAIAATLEGSSIRCRFRPFGPGAARVACGSAESMESLDQRKRWTDDWYSTAVRGCEPSDGTILADLLLTRGFRHQIRAQMAWLGLPLCGDEVYGEGQGPLRLLAYTLEFDAPDGSGRMTVELG